MSSEDDLTLRVARLEAQFELQALKQAYAAAADAKYNPDRTPKPEAEFRAAARRQADYFTPNAIWHGGPFGGDIIGREALFDFFSRSPWSFTVHSYLDPRLAITGARAEGEWTLWELGVRSADGAVVLMTGRTEETYMRLPEGWRIASLRFVALHALPLAAQPEALRALIPTGETL